MMRAVITGFRSEEHELIFLSLPNQTLALLALMKPVESQSWMLCSAEDFLLMFFSSLLWRRRVLCQDSHRSELRKCLDQ